jgi:hypothetical protein
MIDDIEELEAQIPHIFADFAQMKTDAEDPSPDRGEGIYVYDARHAVHRHTRWDGVHRVGHHNRSSSRR